MSEKSSALHEEIIRFCTDPTGTAKKCEPYRLIGLAAGIAEAAPEFSLRFRILLIQNGLF